MVSALLPVQEAEAQVVGLVRVGNLMDWQSYQVSYQGGRLSKGG